MPPFVLAIDIGSSSARSGVFDACLNPVDETINQVEYSMSTGSDGRAEFDPSALVEIVFRCIDDAMYEERPIAAVGISCFWHSLMGVDRSGQPTTSVLTWADTRSAATQRSLSTEIDEFEYHARTGTRLHTSYPAVKLRWIRDTLPDVWSRTVRWMSFPEYLQFELFGMTRVSCSMASGSGLMNRLRATWDIEALQQAGVEVETLSPISEIPFTTVRPAHVRRWPSLARAIWYPAIGDGAANNLGAGAIGPSRPALMIGTTGALRMLTTAPPEHLPAGLWQYRLDTRRALVGGALSEGGGTLAWLHETLDLPDSDEANDEIAGLEPDRHGLTVLPYLSGQRSPDWDSDARFMLVGATPGTRPVDIVQATMESIACSFSSIMDELRPLTVEPIEIVATGNGLRKNRVWAQIIADTLDLPLLMPDQTEASLRGAARYALERFGIELSDDISPGPGQRFEPDRERFDTYSGACERRNTWLRLLDP